MATEQSTFIGPDHKNIFYQCWLPEKKTKAVLIIVHGLGEHSGRYMNLVNHFEPLGFAIYGMDHYGHGKSEGQRLFVPHFNVFTDTLGLFVNKVHEWEPDVPVFLVGHSMGGLITAEYLLDHSAGIKGAVLSGPAVKTPGHVNPVTRMAATVLSRIAPKTGITALDVNHVSRDPEVVKAYLSDPLVTADKVTARLGSQMLEAIDHLTRHRKKIRLPLLIMHGSSDLLVDIEGSKEFFKAVSSEDKTFISCPDRYHEIFNDPGYEDVFSDMAQWLLKRLV